MKNTIIAASMLMLASMASAQTSLVTTAIPNAETNHLRWASGVQRSELKDHSFLFMWNENGARYKVYFTNAGVWMHSVISYEAALLPASVRTLITDAYGNLPISFVDEVRTPGQNTVYRVQLQDAKRLVIVKVAGGELEEEAAYQQ